MKKLKLLLAMNYIFITTTVLLLVLCVALAFVILAKNDELVEERRRAADAERVKASAYESMGRSAAKVKEKDLEVARLKAALQLTDEQLRREKAKNAQEPEEKELFEDKHTNWFPYMDYRKITNPNSDQYALQHDENVFSQYNGIRTLKVNETYFYCVALGGAFGHNIGDAWTVELRNGYKFNIVMGDFKHPINVENAENDFGDPAVNYFGDECLCVIEFIADDEETDPKVKMAGTMSAIPAFGGLYSYDGDIVNMQYIGRVWTP